eukprot:COSAG04_NODE_442_length_14382_cov_72.823566_13_plen_315_part_00
MMGALPLLLLLLALQPAALTSSDTCAADGSCEAAAAEDLSGDGGVLKATLRAGRGAPPAAGSWLRARYVGSLEDGSVFDRSAEGAPLGFALGRGDVIRGWDLAFAAMAVGEVANLSVAHDYAYGVGGLPPRVPPYAALRFEVELLSAGAPGEEGGGGAEGSEGGGAEPLELPDAANVAEREDGVRVMDVDGTPVKLDRLGPIVVQKDGSLKRITNWQEMTEPEQQRTLKVVARRNKMRTGQLEKGDIWADAKGGGGSGAAEPAEPRSGEGEGRAADACASAPCQNGAECYSLPRLSCACRDGYQGDRCEQTVSV